MQDDVIKWKHFPRYWPFVRGIHRSPVNSPRNGQWRGIFMFSLIWARTKGWVNNRDAGDLRRHPTDYDVTVMTAGVVAMRNICSHNFDSFYTERNAEPQVFSSDALLAFSASDPNCLSLPHGFSKPWTAERISTSTMPFCMKSGENTVATFSQPDKLNSVIDFTCCDN